jgi:ABC-type transport system substrate-binding protein
LKAEDFKRSWEDGLKMEPQSSNSSVLDALCDVKGFKNFKQKGALAGVRVLKEDLLEIEFEKPLRSALDFLSASRYAAYKIIDGKSIGTGPYIIRENTQSLSLTPNPYYQGNEFLYQEGKIVVTPSGSWISGLKSGEIDAALFAEQGEVDECDEKQMVDIDCRFGQEGTHITIDVNGLNGRLFSNSKHRLALQALVHQRLLKQKLPPMLQAGHALYDPQSLLAFQPGRMTENKARELVIQGEKYIPDLVKISQMNPIYLVFARESLSWLVVLLKNSGLKISNNSERIERPRYLEMLYKTGEPDLMLGGFSIYNTDPDGLYHALGKNGGIRSPMMGRKRVEDLMEMGKEIIDQRQLAEHYEKVNEAILKEVPYVHLGFEYKAVAYNKNKIKISDSFIHRNNYRITIFEPK